MRIAVIALAGNMCACAGRRGPASVSNPDPSVKIPAIKAAVEANSLTAVRQLVKDLDSDDPAVRFYAIQGLQRLTGETFGYTFYADEAGRAEAVDKWNAWLAGWEAGRKREVNR